MTPLRFTAFSLFPNYFEPFINEGVVARALRSGVLSFDSVNPRDFAQDVRKTVDGHPCGGGDGMVLLPEVCAAAIESVLTPESVVIHVTPGGKVFNNSWARQVASSSKHLIFLCGRYAGFDQRFVNKYAHHELSIGDFVLSGGEVASVCMMDAISRFVPGVLGNAQSSELDSFEDGLLEAPVYTLPESFGGVKVPEVYFSGHHAEIAKYKRKEQIKRTAVSRPDLIQLHWESLSRSEQRLAEFVMKTGRR